MTFDYVKLSHQLTLPKPRHWQRPTDLPGAEEFVLDPVSKRCPSFPHPHFAPDKRTHLGAVLAWCCYSNKNGSAPLCLTRVHPLLAVPNPNVWKAVLRALSVPHTKTLQPHRNVLRSSNPNHCFRAWICKYVNKDS